ncbi:MAG: rane protein [Burkholderiaceae bacterium]|nr:rane protein [Burkholderiaceae bacterium]
MKNAFQFHGRGGEYFGIWIVNILLTIVTLGLYNPWAHVRNKQYFYGNTELAGERFEYLATGKQIFLGRLIAGILFVAYISLSNSMPIVSGAIFLFVMVAFPWVVQRSLRFNAVMTRYRGVRFGFVGTIKDAYVNFLGKPILAYVIAALWVSGVVFVLGIMGVAISQPKDLLSGISLIVLVVLILTLFAFVQMFAWVNQGIASYIHNGYLYGEHVFSAQLETKQFDKIYWSGAKVAVVFVLIAAAIMGGLIYAFKSGTQMFALVPLAGLGLYIGMFAVMLYVRALVYAKIRNYTYGQTLIGAERAYAFESNIMPSDYAVLLFTNTLMVIFSLGLLTPFVRVRIAEFLAKHTAIQGDLDALVTQEQAGVQTGATADALSDVFNLDIQF